MLEHIVAVFDNEGPAAAAERALGDVGIPASAVRRYTTNEGGATQTRDTTSSTEQSGGGFWSWLFGEDTPRTPDYEADRDYYDRRARAGSTVLSVSVADDSKIHRVVEIIESYNPVEIDERTDEEDRDATTGIATSTAGRDFSTGDVARSGAAGGSTASSMTAGAGAASSPTTRSPGEVHRPASGRDETIQLAEEQLEVGKRTVDRGTTRIRRYVVETPVEREVALHGERVTVERRRPMDTAGAPGAGAFEERTVEVHETEEVPVVQKSARVAEEVVVRREGTERTETVHDKVRREEVEITPGNPERTGEPKR